MSTPTRSRALALALTAVLVLGACGGKKLEEESSGGSEGGGSTEAKADLGVGEGESGLAEAGEPKRGGTVTYGLEAESDGGWCLPEAQLAQSGMTVRTAIYDTLTALNSDSKASPFLAESVEPDAAHQTFTITLRKGVTFHDGTDLTAEVVKNNLDATIGRYPARKPLLTTFVFSDLDTVTVTGPLTVQVTTKQPWPTFPIYLSTVGIMAQSQLDDTETCDRKLIGTGPFALESWKRGSALTVTRNEDYWREAPDGGKLPYLDKVVFKPMPEATARVNALKSGDLDMTVNALPQATQELAEMKEAGEANQLVSEDNTEVNYILLNNERPPFDDERMRKAFALALDRDEMNEVLNDGIPTVANQPFTEDSIAYLDDPGFPQYDLDEAKRLVAEAKADGVDPSVVITVQNDTEVMRRGEFIQEQLGKAGISVRIAAVDQAQLINVAIGGKFEAATFRQFPSTDPDTNYLWWKSDSPVNFANIDDPTIDEALETGRRSSDEAERTEAYRTLNETMQANVNNIWLWYTLWAVTEQTNVHGILGPPLPDGAEPSKGLTNGHTMAGVWIDD